MGSNWCVKGRQLLPEKYRQTFNSLTKAQIPTFKVRNIENEKEKQKKKRQALIWLVSVHEENVFHWNKYLWLVKPEMALAIRSQLPTGTLTVLCQKKHLAYVLTVRSHARKQRGLFFFSHSEIKGFSLFIKKNFSF